MLTLTTIKLFFCQTTKKQQTADDPQISILSDQSSSMFGKNVYARIYNLLGKIQEKYPHDETLRSHGTALMNVTTSYQYTSIGNYLLGEKRHVLHTDAAHPLLPGMSSDQVKKAWMQHLTESGSADNPTVTNMTNNIDFKKAMNWAKVPALDDAAKKRIYSS